MPLITDIIQQKKNKNYYSIFGDNEYLFSLSSIDLNYLQLKRNDNISEERLNDLVKTFSLQKAKNYAYKLLSRKAYSKKALIEKLKNRFSEKVSNEVINDLKRLDYINDKKLIIEYARNKLQLKPMGPFKLKQELLNKKFDMDLIKNTIDKIFQEYDEYDLARKVFNKRFENIKTCKDQKILNKIKNYLLSNGFNINTIIEIIKKIRAE